MEGLYNINDKTFEKLIEASDSIDEIFATKLISYYTRTRFLDGIYYLCDKFNIKLTVADLNNVIKFDYVNTKILNFSNYSEENMLYAINCENVAFVNELSKLLKNYNLYFYHAAGKGNATMLRILDIGEIQYFNALLNCVKSGDFDSVDYILDKIQNNLTEKEIKLLSNIISYNFDKNMLIHVKLRGIKLNSEIIKSYFGTEITPYK